MPISFACDFCSRKYRVDDGLAGRKVKCKDCGTDLTIPSGRTAAVAAKPKPAPEVDLYGLEDEPALPPLPRAGSQAEPEEASSGGRRRRRTRASSSDDSGEGLRKAGTTLLIFGGLSFVLPLVGLQIKGLHLMPPEGQAACGILMLVAGALCLAASMGGILKGLVAAGVGAVVLIVVAMFVLKDDGNANAPPINNGNANANPFAGGNPAPPPPPNFPPPNAPNIPNPAAPNVNAAPAVGVHITLSHGEATGATNPFGATMPGVEFSAEYRMVGMRPVGVIRYVTVIESRVGRATDNFSMLRDSGEIGGSVMTFSQNDGPFSMSIEAETHGPGGLRREVVSNVLSLPWSAAPPPQQPQQPQNQPPGFGRPPGFPQPPGMPQNGGFPRGPAMPRFGPRGRP